MSTSSSPVAAPEHQTFGVGCGMFLMADSTMAWPLTPCCKASGKGWLDEDTGEGIVVCRSCFAEVDSIFGDVADHTDERTFRWWAEEHGCTTPEACAADIVARLTARRA